MPFLIPLLLSGAAFFGGAFVGAQVDDKLEPTQPQTSMFAAPSTSRLVMYGLMGVGAVVVWHKLKKAI